MTREDIDFIGAMNMCDEISNEAYKKIMVHCEEEQPCTDAISRQAVIDHIYGINELEGLELSNVFEKHYADFIKSLPSVSTEKLDKAKSEIRCGENKAYNADFTMGCEYAISVIERMFEEQVSTEKTGRWEWNQYDYNPNLGNWHCSECGSIAIECVPKKDPSGVPLYKYCPQCGCRLMEVEE